MWYTHHDMNGDLLTLSSYPEIMYKQEAFKGYMSEDSEHITHSKILVFIIVCVLYCALIVSEKWTILNSLIVVTLIETDGTAGKNE